MVATLAVAGALAHPCRAPLVRGPRVPAPIVLWNSCGSFQLARDGTIQRLPRHWLSKHGGGTGRRWGAHLNLRRTRAGAFVLVLHGHVVWRSSGRYPRDGGDVAFGPHRFAFATYRGGVYVTDLRRGERQVVRGRGFYPYTFTANGDLIVAGGGVLRLVSADGRMLRRLPYRSRNAFAFDERTETLYFVTRGGRLATLSGTDVALARSVARVDGALTLSPRLLVFSGGHSITVTRRNGAGLASTRWSGRLDSDAGVAVSADGRSFAFRLSSAHTATVYVLRGTRASAIYRQRIRRTGCAFGAGLSWHGSSLLYSSSDGTLAVLGPQTVDLTHLALPHRWPLDRPHAEWRQLF